MSNANNINCLADGTQGTSQASEEVFSCFTGVEASVMQVTIFTLFFLLTLLFIIRVVMSAWDEFALGKLTISKLTITILSVLTYFMAITAFINSFI